MRGVWCQALSLSRPPVLGAGSQGPLPVFSGRGWCGCGNISPAPQRALLQAGVARCETGRRASPQNVPLAVARGVCGWALILSQLPVLGASGRGPLSTCCGRACAAVWTRHCFFSARALTGVVRRNERGVAPGGGTTHRYQGRLVSGALPLPAARLRAGWTGPVANVRWARVVQVWEPSTGPTVCPLASRRCALWGWHKGVSGLGCLSPSGRVSGVGCFPSPCCLSSGLAARVRCPLAMGAGVRVWGRGTGPLVCVPYGVPHAAWAAGGCLGGGVFPTVVRGIWCQALSLSWLPVLWAGGAPLPVLVGRGRCGRGDPAGAPQRTVLRAGIARCGAGGRASPGLGCVALLQGASVVRRLSSPGCRSLGQAVVARCRLSVGAGVRLWGPGALRGVARRGDGGRLPRAGDLSLS